MEVDNMQSKTNYNIKTNKDNNILLHDYLRLLDQLIITKNR